MRSSARSPCRTDSRQAGSDADRQQEPSAAAFRAPLGRLQHRQDSRAQLRPAPSPAPCAAQPPLPAAPPPPRWVLPGRPLETQPHPCPAAWGAAALPDNRALERGWQGRRSGEGRLRSKGLSYGRSRAERQADTQASSRSSNSAAAAGWAPTLHFHRPPSALMGR